MGRNSAHESAIPRLRLVKVIVQPVVVLDDGHNLREVQTQTIEVVPAEWPDFPAKLAEQMARADIHEDAGDASADPGLRS